MTLTVRQSSVTGATTAGRALTYAEMDANWAHVIDSSNQSFVQSGTGAIAGNVQDELRRVIWAEQFGATGDGSTDNATAITNAIAAANAASNSGIGYDVHLGKGTFIIQSQVKVLNKVRLIGSGRSATVIKAGASFPINTPLIRIGDGSSIVFGSTVEQMTVDANNVSGSTCVYTTEAQEQSGVRHVVVANYRSKGIDFATAGIGVFVQDCEPSPSSSGSTSGIEVTSCDQVTISRVTVNGTGGGTHTQGILATSSNVCIESIHFEGVTDGIKLSTNVSGYVSGVTGPTSGANVTNLVHLDGNTAYVAVSGLVKNSATNILKDDLTATFTDSYFPFYTTRHQWLGSALLRFGNGSPESSITGNIGSVYLNGTQGNPLWLKYSGTGNTGWKAMPFLLAAAAPATAAPADATEDTLATITVPANAMGANGVLLIRATFSYTNSANNKTLRIRFSGAAGTAFATVVRSTQSVSDITLRIQNRNNAAIQFGWFYETNTAGTQAASNVTGTIDTTASTTVVITGQKATAGETLTLESYAIELQPSA